MSLDLKQTAKSEYNKHILLFFLRQNVGKEKAGTWSKNTALTTTTTKTSTTTAASSKTKQTPYHKSRQLKKSTNQKVDNLKNRLL